VYRNAAKHPVPRKLADRGTEFAFVFGCPVDISGYLPGLLLACSYPTAGQPCPGQNIIGTGLWWRFFGDKSNFVGGITARLYTKSPDAF